MFKTLCFYETKEETKARKMTGNNEQCSQC